MKEKLGVRKAELEKEFNELENKRQQLLKEVNDIQTKLIMLQGSYKEVEDLLKAETVEKKED